MSGVQSPGSCRTRGKPRCCQSWRSILSNTLSPKAFAIMRGCQSCKLTKSMPCGRAETTRSPQHGSAWVGRHCNRARYNRHHKNMPHYAGRNIRRPCLYNNKFQNMKAFARSNSSWVTTISTKAHNDRCNGDIHAFCMNAMLVNGVCAHM